MNRSLDKGFSEVIQKRQIFWKRRSMKKETRSGNPRGGPEREEVQAQDRSLLSGPVFAQ